MIDGPSSHDDLCPSRRALRRALAGVGVGTIAAGVLVACAPGTEPGDSGTPGSPGTPDDATSEVAEPSPSAAETSSNAESPATVVAPASEVPVGQARVVEVAGQRIVVAQPTAGTFVAFSTTCTHEGTPVNVLDGLELACPNHGSRFDAADGSVTRGPATSPLESVGVRLDGDQVVLT